jgi:hypothetical protein
MESNFPFDRKLYSGLSFHARPITKAASIISFRGSRSSNLISPLFPKQLELVSQLLAMSMGTIVFGIIAIIHASNCVARDLNPRDCSFTWSAIQGDTCKSMADAWSITEAQFVSFNPGVECSSLIVGVDYCVEWQGKLSSLSTSLAPPTPTQRPLTPAKFTTKFPAITPKPSTTRPAAPGPTQPNVSSKCGLAGSLLI